MSERTSANETAIALDVDLAEPPEKVWRALSEPAFRDLWLPPERLRSPEPAAAVPGQEASFRMREAEPPFLESMVTFRIAPNGSGGTRLRILHELTDARTDGRRLSPANTDRHLMHAA